jgi:HlyD family secretion protein
LGTDSGKPETLGYFSMDRPLENKKKSYKKPALVAAGGLLALTLVYFIFGDFDTRRIDRDKIRIGEVRKGELKVLVLGNGNIVPRDVEWLVPEVSGTVVEIKAQAGDSLIEGQEIVRLVNDEVVAALAEKESRLIESKAVLAGKEFDLQAQEMDYEANLLKAESEYKDTAAEYEMYLKLAKEHISPVSKLEFQRIEIKAEQLKRLQEVAKKRLANFQSLKNAQLEEYRTKVSAVSDEKTRLEKKVTGLTITARKAGVLQDFSLQQGQRVEIGKIINSAEVFARLKVPALQSLKLRPGQSAVIEINKREVTGTVERIDPNVKGTTIDVDIALNEQLADARVDMFVNGHIMAQQLDDTLFVEKPANSVESGVSKIFKLDGDYANLVSVSTGVSSSNHIQIVDGLNVGDKIIISDLNDIGGAKKLYL